MEVIAGTAVLTTATFTNTAGIVTDPSTVTCKFQGGTNPTQTIDQAQLTHVGTGVWSFILDTTATAGRWTVDWIGTGNCAAISSVTFTVLVEPL